MKFEEIVIFMIRLSSQHLELRIGQDLHKRDQSV